MGHHMISPDCGEDVGKGHVVARKKHLVRRRQHIEHQSLQHHVDVVRLEDSFDLVDLVWRGSGLGGSTGERERDRQLPPEGSLGVDVAPSAIMERDRSSISLDGCVRFLPSCDFAYSSPLGL